MHRISDYTLDALCAGYAGAAWEHLIFKREKGFLGVFRPIYAVGGVLSNIGLGPLEYAAMVGLLELSTSALLDPERQLWDYSDRPSSIKGRTDLLYNLAFGFAIWLYGILCTECKLMILFLSFFILFVLHRTKELS